MLKNKICIILLGLLLSVPVYSEETAITEQQPQAEVVEEESLTEIAEQEPQTEIAEQETEPPEEVLMRNSLKKPVSKRKVAKKFLLAMFSVAVSSGIIYFGLTLYNKFRDGVLAANSSSLAPSKEDTSLDTPSDLSEAVKTFIDKTTWN